jgi:hypothetical protein
MNPNDKDAKQNEPAPERARAPKSAPREPEQAKPRIDFAKLDLTIEKVDERISPSETNVFDK